jgi:hypothetical protein
LSIEIEKSLKPAELKRRDKATFSLYPAFPQ